MITNTPTHTATLVVSYSATHKKTYGTTRTRKPSNVKGKISNKEKRTLLWKQKGEGEKLLRPLTD